MATAIRVSIIGAGSAQFSLGLVKDLCLTASLAGSEVCLMDTDPERLAVIHALAVRYAGEVGADLRFARTTDRAAALRDRDVVLYTAFVRGHRHAQATRERLARHGYYYDGGIQLSDFHNLRLMLDVARDMERLCPYAWLIVSGHPIFAGCTLIARETGVRVCGVCHGRYGVKVVARTIGLDPQRVTWQAPGLNRNIWLTHFLYDGKDAYPRIDEWIATRSEEYWRTHVETRMHDIQLSRGAVHQYRMYGLLPVGETARRGGWWYHTDLATKKRWFGEPWGGPDTELARPLHVQNLERRVGELARLARDPAASLVEAFGRERSPEQQVGIIDALVNNHEGQFQVNVPNRGALEGLPADVVVDVPAIVNAKGIQPLRVGALPPKVMLEQVLPDWLQMERDLLAFKTGDRSMLLWNVLDSHQTRSYDQATAVLEDVLSMEGNEELAAHYRPPAKW